MICCCGFTVFIAFYVIPELLGIRSTFLGENALEILLKMLKNTHTHTQNWPWNLDVQNYYISRNHIVNFKSYEQLGELDLPSEEPMVKLMKLEWPRRAK